MPELNLIEISAPIYLVDTPFNGKFPDAFSFLILDRKTALIDTGCGNDICREIERQYRPDVIINSHCHADHVRGNSIFGAERLIVPDIRTDEIGTVEKLARRFTGGDPKIYEVWKNWARNSMQITDYNFGGTYSAGEVLDFGEVKLEAIHTPGHLDDHFCFLEPERGILFSFDIDLTGFGPWYGNPESDVEKFIASVDKVIDRAPRIVASSHKPPVRENAVGALCNFREKFDRNDRRLIDTLDRPRTIDEVAELKPTYGRFIEGLEEFYYFFEKCMDQKILQRLVTKGEVGFDGDRYFRID